MIQAKYNLLVEKGSKCFYLGMNETTFCTHSTHGNSMEESEYKIASAGCPVVREKSGKFQTWQKSGKSQGILLKVREKMNIGKSQGICI